MSANCVRALPQNQQTRHTCAPSWPQRQYSQTELTFWIPYVHWKIWGSNLGWSKRTIFSPKHPGQHPPSLQLNEKQSFFCGRKVASADSLTTHICIEPNLRIGGAIRPLNLPASMAHIGKTLCTSTSYLCTYNPMQLINHFACTNLREYRCSK